MDAFNNSPVYAITLSACRSIDEAISVHRIANANHRQVMAGRLVDGPPHICNMGGVNGNPDFGQPCGYCEAESADYFDALTELEPETQLLRLREDEQRREDQRDLIGLPEHGLRVELRTLEAELNRRCRVVFDDGGSLRDYNDYQALVTRRQQLVQLIADAEDYRRQDEELMTIPF